MTSSSLTKLQKHAYDYLKDLILTDKLVRNEIYSETKLSKEIGISRTPMRDALQRLSQEGFIDILPSKGFKLHSFTETEIIEIFQVRSAIEGFATFSLTGQYQSEEGIKTISLLENILKIQQDLIISNSSIEEFVDYDTLFHTTIVDFANNNAFSQMFDNYMHRIKTLAIDSLSHPGRIQATLKEHEDILNCIKSGNTQDIYRVTLAHMESPKHINLSSYMDN